MLRLSDKLQLVTSSFFAQGLRICTTLVMARLIRPEDYGVYTLVVSLPALVASFGDFGIAASLVQIREFADEVVVDTAVVLTSVLYAFYAVVTLCGGAYLAHREHDPRLLVIAALVAATNFLGALYNIRINCLNRKLNFRAESRQNVIFSVAQAGTGIALAAAGFGVFALAVQGLAAQVVANAVVMRDSPLGVPRRASVAAARRYLAVGGTGAVAAYVSNVEGNVVNLVVGGTAGKEALGFWGRAVAVQQLFAQNLMGGFERVTYPTLCRANDDVARMRDLVGKALVTVMLFSAFFAGLVWANGDDLVRVILGRQWAAAVPPLLRVAALAIPAGALYSTGYVLCYARGRTQALLRTSVVNVALFIPGLLLARQWGLMGLVYLWTASRWFIACGVIGDGARVVRLPGAVWGRVAGLLGSGCVAAVVICYSRAAAPAGMPVPVRLAATSAAGAVAYGAVVFLTQREVLAFALRMARRGAAGRGGGGAGGAAVVAAVAGQPEASAAG